MKAYITYDPEHGNYGQIRFDGYLDLLIWPNEDSAATLRDVVNDFDWLKWVYLPDEKHAVLWVTKSEEYEACTLERNMNFMLRALSVSVDEVLVRKGWKDEYGRADEFVRPDRCS